MPPPGKGRCSAAGIGVDGVDINADDETKDGSSYLAVVVVPLTPFPSSPLPAWLDDDNNDDNDDDKDDDGNGNDDDDDYDDDDDDNDDDDDATSTSKVFVFVPIPPSPSPPLSNTMMSLPPSLLHPRRRR